MKVIVIFSVFGFTYTLMLCVVCVLYINKM